MQAKFLMTMQLLSYAMRIRRQLLIFVSSRYLHYCLQGLFSSSQMYIVDEYCARYSVRLSHRHLTCLREWLSCELRGVSIWPVMMLHSFGFCQMHIMGKA